MGYAKPQLFLFIEDNHLFRRTLLHLIEDIVHVGAEKGGDDGRRRFVCSQTVHVCSRADGCLEQAVVFINSHQRIDEKSDKAQILFRRLARGKQSHACVCTDRPVAVLAGAVHAGKRFFMQQHAKAVTTGYLFHQQHDQLVLIDGKVRFVVDRCQFKLVRRHFVVACFERNTVFAGFKFEVFHIRRDTRRDRTEIVIFELLVLGRLMPEQCPTGHQQVGACSVKPLIHKKIFLLPSQIRRHFFHVRVEIMTHVCRSPVDGIDGFQQRSFQVERFTGIRDENGGDAQRVVHDKCRRRRVPSRISARLERAADASARKARRVRLLLRQQFAGKFFGNAFARPIYVIDERVVLLRRPIGQRLKPVRVVRGAQLHRPHLHACGYVVGNAAV